jgi:hypothetical protein
VSSSTAAVVLSPENWRSRLAHWTKGEALLQHEDKILLLLTLIIGAVVGLVVAAFIFVTENLGARMYPAGGAAWRRVLIPTGGALITGYLLSRFFSNARGSGIPQTKVALFLRDGFISPRTVVGKFGCCSASLASGIALGREGPSVQVGAGIASVLGRRLGLGPNRIRELIPVGAAAALAAAFNTPVAAVLFTLEEVMGDLHAPVLGSIVLGSATSWVTLHLLLGDEPLFHVPSYQLVSSHRVHHLRGARNRWRPGLSGVRQAAAGYSQVLSRAAEVERMATASSGRPRSRSNGMVRARRSRRRLLSRERSFKRPDDATSNGAVGGVEAARRQPAVTEQETRAASSAPACLLARCSGARLEQWRIRFYRTSRAAWARMHWWAWVRYSPALCAFR